MPYCAADILALLGIRACVRASPVYLLLARSLWYAVLLSGVHVTIAGVLGAATIPLKSTPGNPDSAESPLHRLEHAVVAAIRRWSRR